MAQLTLSLLGTFHVTLGEEPITKFRSANVQGLLVYLALHAERPIARDLLAALFWPEESETTARANFRQTLYQLRKLLDKQTAQPPFFTVTRQTVQLNPDSDTACDVTHFLQAIKQGDLATAVAGYHGDLLPAFTCDSLEFEAWLRLERERLHGIALDAMQQRTDWRLRSGAAGAAKALALRQLALEPWRELAHRQLMQAHALSGDRQAALAQFAACKDALWTELAAEPAAETAALAAKIEAGEPLQIASRPRHNLIVPITTFFGREEDLAQVCAHITAAATRLVTLTGPGGIGKSRLALEAAWRLREQFADGVWFVPLAGVSAPPSQQADEVATAVAQALDQPLRGPEPAPQQLRTLLRSRRLLLVLDNFEHLLDAGGMVLDLLHHAPDVCVICTSREALNFQAEWVLPLHRLPLPLIADPFLNTANAAQDPAAFPAVQLFVDRAQRANGRFQLAPDNAAAVVTLCRLLAGVPLALELAAAALRRQSLPQLLAHLQHSIDALTTIRRDIPARHRSLRAVFDSSWQTLAAVEQRQLAALSIFRGPFSANAAAAVTDADLHQLHMLQEKSLLQKEGDRFALHPLLRQFAAEKRPEWEDEAGPISRHAHYYLTAVAELAGALQGEMPHLAVQRIARAQDNVRRAWQTAVAQHDVPLLLAALAPLSDFFQIRGQYREGVQLFAETAAALRQRIEPGATELHEPLAQVLAQQAAMHVRLGACDAAVACIDEALSLTADAWVTARLHLTWCETMWRQGQLVAAAERAAHGLALAKAIDAPLLTGIGLFYQGVIDDLAGKRESSLVQLEAALAHWRAAGNRRLQGFTLSSIGVVLHHLARYAAAQDALQEALLICRANDDRQAQIVTLNNLSLVATAQADYAGAERSLRQALPLAEAVASQDQVALLRYNLAWNASRAGKWEAAAADGAHSLALYRQVGNRRGESKCLLLLGRAALANGRLHRAQELMQDALALSRQVGDRAGTAEANAALAALAAKKERG